MHLLRRAKWQQLCQSYGWQGLQRCPSSEWSDFFQHLCISWCTRKEDVDRLWGTGRLVLWRFSVEWISNQCCRQASCWGIVPLILLHQISRTKPWLRTQRVCERLDWWSVSNSKYCKFKFRCHLRDLENVWRHGSIYCVCLVMVVSRKVALDNKGEHLNWKDVILGCRCWEHIAV